MKITLRVLVLKEQVAEGSYMWVAQCLDHDFNAQGKTLSEMRKAFEVVALNYIKRAVKSGREPFSDMPPAPAYYLQRWNESRDNFGNRYPLPADGLEEAQEADFRFALTA